MKPRTKILLFVVALPILLYGCVLVVKMTGCSGKSASATMANLFLESNHHLPQTASDVYYYTDFGASEAEFKISEHDFLDWCNSKNWTPEPISDPVHYFYPTWGPEEDNRMVSRGYSCYATGGVLTFDAERSRASLRVSDFP